MDELKAESARMERERQEELILEPQEVQEIQQRKPLLSKDEVIIRADDLARLQETAAMAQSALDKAKEFQKERDRLRAELEAERRRAPGLIREVEAEAERIRKEVQQEADRARLEAAAEIRRMERRQEALRVAISRLETVMEEKEIELKSPDKNILKLHKIISEIEEQEARDLQERRFDRIGRDRAGISEILEVAQEKWRVLVPENRRTPELDIRHRRPWENSRGRR